MIATRDLNRAHLASPFITSDIPKMHSVPSYHGLFCSLLLLNCVIDSSIYHRLYDTVIVMYDGAATAAQEANIRTRGLLFNRYRLRSHPSSIKRQALCFTQSV